MFTSDLCSDILCAGASAVVTYVIYTYRYDCFYKLCVLYACCKRKCRRKKEVDKQETNAFRTLDFTDRLISKRVSCENAISSVALFPHIKEIQTSIENREMLEKIHYAVREYKVIYHTNRKIPPSSILATRKVCLYRELAKEFAILPPTITVVLDKPLIDLLNIKLPVRSLTGNATYVLSENSEETIVLHR